MKLNNVFSVILEMKIESYPPRPYEMMEFEKLSKAERKDTARRFYDQDHIKEYMDKNWKAQLHNRDCFLHMDSYIKSESCRPEEKEIVLKKMADFRDYIMSNEHPFRALMLNFNDYEIPQPAVTSGAVDWTE